MDNSLILCGILIFLLFGVVLFLALRQQKHSAALARSQFLTEQLAEQKQVQEKLELQMEHYRQELEASRQAEKLALQKVEHSEAARKEWELQKQEFEKMARASVLTVGQELSSKLLADHRREAEEVKAKIEEKNQKHAAEFLKQFSSLTESVAAIRQISTESKQQSEILWRAMSAPSAAGQLTEVALENLLKNLGLREGVDFSLQHSVSELDGAGLRPDCVVYLPHDRVMIIDCKASKHQLELAAAEGGEGYAQAQEKFRLAMHKHLEMLSRKGYMTAIIEEYLQKTGRKPHHQIMNVMYIASESAVEKLDAIDPSFREKMQKAGIIPVGPSGLQAACSIASHQIAEARKAENQEHILHEVERLLGGFATAFGHVVKLSNSLKQASTHLSGFTGSYNRTVAPKLRQLQKLGVKAEGKQTLPERMPVFELRSEEDWLLLESEEHKTAEIEDFSPRKASA